MMQRTIVYDILKLNWYIYNIAHEPKVQKTSQKLKKKEDLKYQDAWFLIVSARHDRKDKAVKA